MDRPSKHPVSRGRAALALSAALSCASLTSTGCASWTVGADTGLYEAVDLDRPEMRQFAVATMTDMERDVRLDTGGEAKNEKLTPALFWTGIIAGTVGAVGGIGFGAAGYASKQQLNKGYESGGLSVEDRDGLVSRGEAFNASAIAFTTLAVLGYSLAVVAYGVDWNRCGPLVHKKRRCKELGLAAR